MIRACLFGLLAAFSLPALAANVTATTGYTQVLNSNEPSGSYTIDAGTNRKFVCLHTEERDTDPQPITFTIGGQSPTQVIGPYQFAPTEPAITQWHFVYIWNETKIAAMSGTAASYTDANSALQKAFLCVTIEDTDQANLSGFADTDGASAGSSLTLTTTSNASDLVFCSSVAEATTATHTWTGLTERHDADGGDAWRTSFADGNADSVTATYAVGTEDVSAACVVFADGTAAPTASVALAKHGSNTTSITFDITFDQNVDVDWGFWNKDATVPANCTEVDTGTGALSTDNGSQTATAGVEYQWTVSVVAPIRIGDIYVCGSNANGNTGVLSLTDQTRTTLSGYATVTDTGADGLDDLSPFKPYSATADTTMGSSVLTNVMSTDRFVVGELLDLGDGTGFDDDGPDVVESVDHVEDELELSEEVATSSEMGITFTNLVKQDGTALFSPALGTSDWGIEYQTGTAGTDCDAMETCLAIDEDGLAIVNTLSGSESAYKCYNAYFQHYGTGTGLFAAPIDVVHKLCINNTPPTASFADAVAGRVLTPGSAIDAIDFAAAVVDPEGGATTTYIISTLPASLSYSSSTGLLTGTLDAEDEDGFLITFVSKDEGDYWVRWSVPAYGVTQWTPPDVVGDTDLEAAKEELAPAWRGVEEVTQTSTCDDMVASGTIRAQSPAAGVESDPDVALSIDVSSGACPVGSGNRSKGVTMPGISPFL